MLNDSSVFNETQYQIYLNDPPGQKYTLDQQCEDLTGEIGAISVGLLSDVCRVMRCHKPSHRPRAFTRYYNTALNFSSCGYKMVMTIPNIICYGTKYYYTISHMIKLKHVTD